MKRALGVCYHPEHWPEETLVHDAKRMARTGLTWVRIEELPWSRLEPEPGRYDFAWLDRAIDTLGNAGLKVILCTPLATPPGWMLERFPDMLAVDAQGQPREVGSRRCYCHSHAGYRDAAAAMADLMGKRYADNPHVAAWEIGNEYGCDDSVLSYSDAARVAFCGWLAQHYQSVDALNNAWGNEAGAMAYPSFDQIDLPNQSGTTANPAHQMAYRRFASDQVVAWNAAQVAALRPHTSAPLIHNYTGQALGFDHFAASRALDIASWSSDPIGFLPDRLEASPEHKAYYLQQGDPDMQAFHHDLYRAMNHGRWWVMAQQSHPVNRAPLPGMVRLWTWEAFAHGAEVVGYSQWRRSPTQDPKHAGLVRPDDTPSAGLEETAQVARELARMPYVASTQSPIALIFDYSSAWAWDVLPQGADFDYFRLVFDAYRALRRNGLSIDILPADTADLSGYKLIFAPGLATLPSPLREAISKVSTHIMVGPRANLVTPELSDARPPGPDLPGLDAKVTGGESLPPGVTRPLRGGGAIINWIETLEGSGDLMLETADGAPVGMAAGPLCYLAGWPDSTLWDRMIGKLAEEVGLTLNPMPAGLRLRDTATHRFAFNYGPESVTWNGEEIPAADFRRWPLEEATSEIIVPDFAKKFVST